MNQSRQIMIHSAGMVILFFAQWLISTLLVRLGGFYEAGIFSLAMTISNVFAYIGNFGIRTYMLADTEKRFSQRQYRSAVLIALLISYGCCLIYLLTANHYSVMEGAAILLYLTYTNLTSYCDLLYGRIQLKGRLDLNGYSHMIRGGACLLAFILSYVLLHQFLFSLIMMVTASAAVLVLFDAEKYREVVRKPAFGDTAGWRDGLPVLMQCVPVMLNSVLPLIVTAIPRGTIQRICGTEALGYFASVFTPAVLISVLVPAVLQGILPKLAESWNHDLVRMKKLILIELGVVLAVTGLALGGAALAGRPVMSFVFGEAILPYYPLLYWAILATGLNAVIGIGNNLLVAMGEKKVLIISCMIPIVVCAALVNGFVQRRQLYGAVFSLIAANISQIIFQTIIIWEKTLQKEKNAVTD